MTHRVNKRRNFRRNSNHYWSHCLFNREVYTDGNLRSLTSASRFATSGIRFTQHPIVKCFKKALSFAF